MNKNNTDDKQNHNSKKKADMEDKEKDKKKPDEEQVVNNDNQNESDIKEKSEAEQLKDRITELEALVNSHKDKMLRAVADCENTKKKNAARQGGCRVICKQRDYKGPHPVS